MAEYQPNSHRSKEAAAEKEISKERKIEPVVKGKVKVKKNDVRKLANLFISEDAANVKSYVFMDVIVPTVKKLFLDIIIDGAKIVLDGETGHSSRRSGDRVSYRSYYDEPRGRDRDRDDRRGRSRFDYDDLVFETRGEAELVRDHMLDTVERYGVVTVGDMYDMADLTAPFTAGRYGWMGLRYIEVKRVRDGYILQLPKAMPID